MVLLASSPPVVTVGGEVGESGEGVRDSSGEDMRGATGEDVRGGTGEDVRGGTGEDVRGGTGEDVRGGTGEEVTVEEAAVSSVVEFDTDCVIAVVFSSSAADGVSSEVGGS